ncbi:FAD binding domain-containing protein [Cladochytrium replicatum]|nr:FAD binding domain-containing protein [Cladochytrium replicatum]
MSTSFNVDVLIVGGGPTGMFAAMELARYGIKSVRVIDSKETTCTQPRGLVIHARSLELLSHHNGLTEALFHHGTLVRGIKMRNEEGNEIGGVFFEDANMNTKFSHICAIAQTESEMVLHQYLGSHYGINVEFNTDFVSMETSDDCVTTIVKDKVTGETTAITSRFLIACDGGRSAVRHALKVPFEGYAVTAVIMNIDIHVTSASEEEYFHDDEGLIIMGDKGVMGIIPCERNTGRKRIIAFTSLIPPADNQPIPVTIEDVQKVLDERAPFLKAKVHDPVWMTHFWSQQRKVPLSGYRPHPRVFLAGDAAHVHLPVGGWGMNTGFQDVANLSWKLSLHLRHLPNRPLVTDLLLSTYAAERSPVGDNLEAMTGRPATLITLPIPKFVTTAVRTAVLPTLLRFPIFKGLMLNNLAMMGISYAKSDIHMKGQKGWAIEFLEMVMPPAVAPGSRAPDGDITDEATETQSRIYDAILSQSRSFVVLLFTDTNEDVEAWAGAIDELKTMPPNLGVDLHVIATKAFTPSRSVKVWVDTYKKVAKLYGYGESRSGVAVIRPDQYLSGLLAVNQQREAVKYFKDLIGCE